MRARWQLAYVLAVAAAQTSSSMLDWRKVRASIVVVYGFDVVMALYQYPSSQFDCNLHLLATST